MENTSSKSSLILVAPVDWEVVSFEDNEYILCSRSGAYRISAKVRLVPYSGSEGALRGVFYNRINSTATVIDFRNYDFIHENVKWIVDSYVCADTSEVYRSLYYAVLDDCYLVVEMMANSQRSALCFTSEAKRLMTSIDYGAINRLNKMKVGERVFSVKTPNSFRYSSLSTNEKLMYLGENGYLLVNHLSGDTNLAEYVAYNLDNTIAGVDLTVSVVKEEVTGTDELVQYEILRSNRVVGSGTYYKQLVNNYPIVSYLYENGSPVIEPKGLLEIVEEV